MKAITKILVTGIGIGVGVYMAQLGEKESRFLKEKLKNPFQNQNKDNKRDDLSDTSSQDTDFLGKFKKSVKKVLDFSNKDTDNVSEESVPEDNDLTTHSEPSDTEKPRTIEDELKDGKDEFAYLLPLTKSLVSVDEECKIDSDMVYKSWEDGLSDKYPLLLSEFDAVSKNSDYESDTADDEKLKKVLSLWLDYLEKFRICEYSDNSVNEDGLVTVTVENRRFYINGRDFEDGEVCSVRRKPWVYNETVYCSGILDALDATADTVPQEDHNE